MAGISSIKARLAGLRWRSHFVDYFEAPEFAAELRDLLGEIRGQVREARAGLELVGSFYRSDEAVFESLDDSDGLVGAVFRLDAAQLFTRYAGACADKPWLAGFIFELLREDGYSARATLLDSSALFLPEAELRALAERMWDAAASEEAEGLAPPVSGEVDFDWDRVRWLTMVEQVATQLNDPRLFERARRAHSPGLGVAARIDIAAAWLAAGEAAVALQWLEPVGEGESFMADQRDALLHSIYRELGDRGPLERLVRRRFQADPSLETLDDLLEVIGAGLRDEMVAEVSAGMLGAGEFSASGAEFLIDCGRSEDAARHVVERREQVNGEHYWSLVPLAEALEAVGQPVAAAVIYRTLLDSILARAYHKAYPHAARYLRWLERTARSVGQWGPVPSHEEYLRELRVRHGRKYAFWRR